MADDDITTFCSICACVSVIAFIGLAVTSFGMLEYNEYGLDLSHITKTVNDQTYSAGIHFLGVGHEFLKFPRTVQTIEFSTLREADGPMIQSRTQDGLEVVLEISFQYKLMPEELFDLYTDTGMDYHNYFSNQATFYTAYNFFMNRTQIGNDMFDEMNLRFQNQAHATIDFFQLRAVDLPRDFEEAIQLSEVKKQDILIANAEKNKIEIQLETKIIQAEYQKNVTIVIPLLIIFYSFKNLAQGNKTAQILGSLATAETFQMVQKDISTQYKTLRNSLNMDDYQFINYLKAKLIRDFNGKKLITNIQDMGLTSGGGNTASIFAQQPNNQRLFKTENINQEIYENEIT